MHARIALTALALTIPLVAQDEPSNETPAPSAATPAPPDVAPPSPEAPAKPALDLQSGKVTVQGGMATIDLPDGWRYLQQKDARHVVEDLWGNPPDPSTLGLVVPPQPEDGDGPSWAIIVSFESEGYVKDDDAGSIDYDDLLADMQKDAREANPERKKQGYPTAQLVGWAEPPHYDAAEKKLYWAKDLRFEDEQGDTLNYDVRVLGRRGVLVMQAVASLEDLPAVAEGSKQILARTEFTAGHRYSDFNPSIDKIAAYGIGGLIAGKLLVKAGLLKLLIKPLLVAGAAVAAFLGRMFGRRKKASSHRSPTGGATGAGA